VIKIERNGILSDLSIICLRTSWALAKSLFIKYVSLIHFLVISNFDGKYTKEVSIIE